MPVHSTFKAMLFQRCTANNVTKAQKKKMEENEFFFRLRSCSDPDELANLFILKWNEKHVFITEHPFRNW